MIISMPSANKTTKNRPLSLYQIRIIRFQIHINIYLNLLCIRILGMFVLPNVSFLGIKNIHEKL